MGRKETKKGFSLIEIMIYIALLAVLMVAVTQFTWDVLYGGVNAYVDRELQQNARFSLEKMTYEIRNSENIESLSAKELVLGRGGDPNITIKFNDGAQNITIQEEGGPEEVLTADKIEVSNGIFTDMSYTYPGGTNPATKNVKISMDFNYENPEVLLDWAAFEHYETTVEIRGY
ncbi:MAG: prepilin-type N-terminal cleavage/methylation domain-containing protein [Patescibacteria group bacterium]|nr:prepilin-type N-terminal cleavage/methylation domain-containing protein [Patescibacteria group bacterium]